MTETAGANADDGRESNQRRPVQNGVALLIALAALFVSLWYAFLVPARTGDTFMTLAGGRDVVEGKLGQTDDWSFVSEDRVWINQSWGTGLLFYTLWNVVGSFGLVIYKGVSVALLALFLILAARQCKSTYTVAALVVAYVLTASAPLINIRANLLGLSALAMLLWLILRSLGRPHRIWFALLLLTFWAHMHGSFIFGIAILGLWTVFHLGVAIWKGRPNDELRSLWPLPTATVLAIVLAAATSPFGIANLKQPFTLVGLFVDEPWPSTNLEMTPLFSDYPGITVFPGLGWYLFLLGVLVAPLVLRVLARLTGRSNDIPRLADLKPDQLTTWCFVLILVAFTVIMSLAARRFIPVSLIICAPLLANEFQWLLANRRYAWPSTWIIVGSASFGILVCQYMSLSDTRPFVVNQGPLPSTLRWTWGGLALFVACSPLLVFRYREPPANVLPAKAAKPHRTEERNVSTPKRQWLTCWTTPTLALLLLAILSVQLQDQRVYHRTDTPLQLHHENLFNRLVMMGQFPKDAIGFLEDNDIRGNAVTPWNWEGFLRWYRPEIKVMVGGRSRQVYSAQDYREYQTAYITDDNSFYSQLGIQWAVVPRKDHLTSRIFKEPDTPWRIIYYDSQSLVAAEMNDPTGRQFIDDAEAGNLIYSSAKSKTHTLAAQRLAFSSDASESEIFAALAAATKIHPTPQLYLLLLAQQARNQVLLPEIVVFFESELARLDGHNDHHPLGYQVMLSRKIMSSAVAKFYAAVSPAQKKRAHLWRRYSRQCDAAAKALAEGHSLPLISEIPSP